MGIKRKKQQKKFKFSKPVIVTKEEYLRLFDPGI